MILRYKDKIIEAANNTLSTANTLLEDNIVVENNSNYNLDINYNEETIGAVAPYKKKSISTKGQYLKFNINFSQNKKIEYYLISQNTSPLPSQSIVLNNINTYFMDGDYIEIKFNTDNYPENTSGELKYWISLLFGQPKATRTDVVEENAYKMSYVNTKNTQNGDSFSLTTYAKVNDEVVQENQSLDYSQSESRYGDKILRFNKDGVYFSYGTDGKNVFYTFTEAEKPIFYTLWTQLKRDNNLFGAAIKDPELIVRYFKLVLGPTSTTHYHNINYTTINYSVNSLPTTIQRGNNYTLSVIPQSNQFIKELTVLMSNSNINSLAVKDNQIKIPVVIGDLDIFITILENEELLLSNYFANNSQWSQNISYIDFSADDYIELKIDLSTCVNNKENIFSFGQNIDKYTSADSGVRLHAYYTKSTGELRLQYIQNTSAILSTVQVPASSPVIFKISKNGLLINGIETHTSGSETYEEVSNISYNEKNLLTAMNTTKSGFSLGSLEGSNRSNATYEYIKVVHINPNTEEENNE